ncbi:MAG: hypothetical protein LBR06_02570 [Bacteroidales bacterium]|jgi:hypothetical protein|nr:hypothetical protein [Bacteroidales bacterium]
MELGQILLSGRKHDMIAYVHNNPGCINNIIMLALSDSASAAWRAAWLLESVMADNDRKVRPHVPRMIGMLPNVGESQKRLFLMILQRMEIDGVDESRLFDICTTIWEDLRSASGVRCYAFKILLKIARKYPDLINEIRLLTEQRYMETLSPGIRHSIRLAMQREKLLTLPQP